MVADRVQFKTQSGDKPFNLKISDVTTGQTLYEVNVPAGDGAAFGGSVPLPIGARLSLAATVNGPSAGTGGPPTGRSVTNFKKVKEDKTDANNDGSGGNEDCPESEQDENCDCPDPDYEEEEEESTDPYVIPSDNPPTTPTPPTIPVTPPTGPGETPDSDDDDEEEEEEENIYPVEPTTPTTPDPTPPPGIPSPNGGDQYGSQSSTDARATGFSMRKAAFREAECRGISSMRRAASISQRRVVIRPIFRGPWMRRIPIKMGCRTGMSGLSG